MTDTTTDVAQLTELNTRFIDACRRGSWADLQPILSPNFSYLDGRTGQVDDIEKYAKDLDGVPDPALEIDQVVVHVDGNTAIVSARAFADTRPGRFNRYLDTYERRDGQWVCIHASVWRIAD
jgi:hypothetical protein